MSCIVVTCGGWGDVWSHETRTEAWLHPLTQYGDALIESSRDVLDEYNAYEWPRLAEFVDIKLTAHDLMSLASGVDREARAVRERTVDTIWACLQSAAEPALTNPEAICEQVSRDKRRSTMAKKEPTVKVVAEKKAPAEKTASGPRGTPHDAVIRLQVDAKTGKTYGVDHNPKKAGSKGAERFAMYEDGMTVKAAIDSGIWAADITWDIGKGFIALEGGTHKAPKAPKAAAPAEEAVAA